MARVHRGSLLRVCIRVRCLPELPCGRFVVGLDVQSFKVRVLFHDLDVEGVGFSSRFHDVDVYASLFFSSVLVVYHFLVWISWLKSWCSGQGLGGLGLSVWLGCFWIPPLRNVVCDTTTASKTCGMPFCGPPLHCSSGYPKPLINPYPQHPDTVGRRRSRQFLKMPPSPKL